MPTFVFGASLSFETESLEVKKGSTVRVVVSLEAKDEPINALEGEMIVSPNFILKEIQDGGTIVNFWVESPKVAQNKAIFAGVIPGGFLGERGTIFTAILEAKGDGVASISLNNVRALLQDEEGSEVSINVPRINFNIDGELSSLEVNSTDEVPVDSTPPEPFNPMVANYNEIYDGAWFVAFSTGDKDSGIARFEIQESKSKSPEQSLWVEAKSPYLLFDQNRESYIHIRALDFYGNERIATINPQGGFLGRNIVVSWGIILLIALSCGVAFYVYRRSRRNSVENNLYK